MPSSASKFRDEFDRKRNDYTRAGGKSRQTIPSRLRKKKQGEDKIEGEEYPFTENDFILVDPPRAGLDEITLDLVREFKDVIYISCDARSLARDLGERKLSETHRVKRLAAFDHFPWHADFLEVVCQLEKK